MFLTTSGLFEIHKLVIPARFRADHQKGWIVHEPFAAMAFRPPSHQSAAKVSAPKRKKNEVSREVPSLLPVAGDEVEVLIADTISLFPLDSLIRQVLKCNEWPSVV
jgi:hypothetical protein